MWKCSSIIIGRLRVQCYTTNAKIPGTSTPARSHSIGGGVMRKPSALKIDVRRHPTSVWVADGRSPDPATPKSAPRTVYAGATRVGEILATCATIFAFPCSLPHRDLKQLGHILNDSVEGYKTLICVYKSAICP